MSVLSFKNSKFSVKMFLLTIFLVLLSFRCSFEQRSNFSSSDLPATCAVPGEKPLPLPAIFCPNPIRPNTELIYSSYEDSFPEKECLRCSLTLNNENSAVFVKCFRCQRVFKPPSLVETQKCVEMAERTKKK